MTLLAAFLRRKNVVLLRVLLFFVVITTQTNFGTTAPTQHLTLSSAGRTPMVVVTFSENISTQKSAISHFPKTTRSDPHNESSSQTTTVESKPILRGRIHKLATSSDLPSVELGRENESQSERPTIAPYASMTNSTATLATQEPDLSKPGKKRNESRETKASSNQNRSYKVTEATVLSHIDEFTPGTPGNKMNKFSTDVKELHSLPQNQIGNRTYTDAKTWAIQGTQKNDNHNQTANEINFGNDATYKSAKVAEETRTKVKNKTDYKNGHVAQKYTLSPVQNGFLGPIHMAEKTFPSVRKGSKPTQHQFLVESLLQKRKFVEIIPPKPALLPMGSTEVQTDTSSSITKFQKSHPAENLAPSSSTAFQVPDVQTSTTLFPNNTHLQSTLFGSLGSQPRTPHFSEYSRQTESKISDIQIEVYDSTVGAILSSANFKESNGFSRSPGEIATDTTKPPSSLSKQEKFTQYVIDNSDFSTQKSNSERIRIDQGKPEPATIEIHINVSEGLQSTNRDLELAYPQSEFVQLTLGQGQHVPIVNFKPPNLNANLNVSDANSSERSQEVLIVEVFDSRDNNTETSASFENIKVNPVSALRLGTVKDVYLKDQEPFVEANSSGQTISDESVMPQEGEDHAYEQPREKSTTHSKRPHQDHDSDTIFYISNTEVKVGESLPTTTMCLEQQLKKAKLESQFFPANFVSSTRPNVVQLPKQLRYEEDIILSPNHNTADTVKVYRDHSGNPSALDVTYVGEPIIEVAQSAVAGATTPAPCLKPTQGLEVVIQPAISIGVPIIGELPPQTELKEIDFMPGGEKDGVPGGNEVEKDVESSIQYGGDLIDEGGVMGGGGFDSIEGSYPFGSSAIFRIDLKSTENLSDAAGIHRVNNLKREELMADISGSAELSTNSSEDSINIKGLMKDESDFAVDDGVHKALHIQNETEFFVLDDNPKNKTGSGFMSFQLMPVLLSAASIPLLAALFCGTRYFYRRFRARRNSDRNGSTNHLANGKTSGDNDSEEPTAWPSQTEHLSALASTDAIIDSTKSRNNSWEIPILSSSTLPAPKDNPSGNSAAVISKAWSGQSNSVLSSHMRPSGSVTTMTLKNNHLIVETEERNDISRDARETKMHYSTGEKDGIFIVEVARGVDSKSMPDSPITRTSQSLLPLEAGPKCVSPSPVNTNLSIANRNSGEVQIHQPPREKQAMNRTEELPMVLHQIDEVDEPVPSPHPTLVKADGESFGLGRVSSTGLSQSDLSSTSSADSNKRYSYGNQELYTLEKPVCFPLLPPMKSPLQVPSDKVNDDDHQSGSGQSPDRIQTTTELVCTAGDTARHEEHREMTSGKEQYNSRMVDSRAEVSTSNDQLLAEKLELVTRPGIQHGGDQLHSAIKENFMEARKLTETSLPDPPSLEEIEQLNDCSFLETNQLDSLPPPPLPPEVSDDLKQEAVHLYEGRYLSTNRLPAPLTPPASPPHYSTCGNEVPPSVAAVAVAVNVNGS